MYVTVPVCEDEAVWREHVEGHHVASAAEEVTRTRHQSMLATICRNFRKGGIPCALQLAANM